MTLPSEIILEIILEGIVGSTAYGLAHAGSDIDKLGIWVAPTEDILGLTAVTESIVHTEPDSTYHEVAKYIRLSLAANPTVLELLFLETHTIKSEWGQIMIDLRHSFLSQRVRSTYGGYAMQQITRLRQRGDFGSDLKKRYAKHARHCFRLLQQGTDLLQSGELMVRVKDPDFIMSVGELPPDELEPLFEREYERLKATPSNLPLKPTTELANRVLIAIRRDYL